jgi:CBS domain-containing protein
MKTDEVSTVASEQSVGETVAATPSDATAANGKTASVATRKKSAQRRSPKKKGQQRLPRLSPRDVIGLVGALLFLLLGFAGIYAVVKVAGEKDGTVLVALLVVPALVYLLLSGRVQDLKGPGGLELTLAEVANEQIPLPDDTNTTRELSFEKITTIEKGLTTALDDTIQKIPAGAPIVLTFKLGSEINGPRAASYARRLTQLRRFRFVAIVDTQGKLVSYMEESAFRHTIEAEDPSGMVLINNIREKHVGEVTDFPGMIVNRLSPRTSIAQALRKMERTHLDALLVVEEGKIVGIAERDHLANILILSLIDRARPARS